MQNKEKIAIIGSYPPPYGGISVHVQRITIYLKKNEYILYNTAPNRHANSVHFYGKARKVLILISFFFKKFHLIHCHSHDKTVRVLLCLLGIFKRNIYLHIHGASLEDNFSDKTISSYLLKKILKNVSIIVDNTRIRSLVIKYKPRNVYEIDAFLPPLYKENIYTSFNKQNPPPKAKILISMVGWFNEFRNTDLYGYDLALQVLDKLRGEYRIDIAIFASVNGIINDNIYNQFAQKLSELKLEKYFKLITDEVEEIWPLYLMSDIFIRPTISDGSSVALLEAKWFEAKTIASDAVPRPDGVILFNDRDVKDLIEKIHFVIGKGFTAREERLHKIINKKFESKLIKDIYKIER